MSDLDLILTPKENPMTALDLDQIPHPRDCHRVPVGATIPAGTFLWSMPFKDSASYGPSSVDWVVREGDYYLTAEPIPAPVPAPTPADSPIIAGGTDYRGRFTDALLYWDDGGWWGVTPKGVLVVDAAITGWQPAIVTPTGRGVMDDRDKRHRIDREGRIWMWEQVLQLWMCIDGCDEYGYDTLATIDEAFGPLRFADKEADR